jgi:hypothetical protein
MGPEHRFPEDVVDAVLGLVLVHGDLLEHDLALGVDLGVGGTEEHLGEQLERAIRVDVEEAGVKLRRLLACRRVHGRPEPVEHLRDLLRGMALGALEQQVLEEVRHPSVIRVLVARADPDPQSERHRAHRGDRLGDDAGPLR